MRFLKIYWPEMAAVLSGVLLALCYPHWDIGNLVWIWQAPLLTALWFSKPRPSQRSEWKRGFYLAYLSGLSFFVLNLNWFTEISKVAESIWAGVLALFAITIYLALYFGVFGIFAITVGKWKLKEPDKDKKDLFEQSFTVLKVAFLNGACWCGLEWLRGVLFTGFGWNGLGVALKEQLLLVQFADTIGITGYGFVMMFSGIILYCTLVRFGLEAKEHKRLRPHFDFALGVAIIIGLFLYGSNQMRRTPKDSVTLRSRIMQMNIPLEEKWSEDIRLRQKVIFDYRDLTRTFIESSPHDLVLWPETALPGHFAFPWVQKYFNDYILKGEDFYLLTGLEDSTLQGDEIYNTITLMKGSTESYQMHRKMHLIPFGEYIPFRKTFPLFEWIAGGIISSDFTPGESYETLTIEKEGHAIGVIPLICFEDTIARHARKFIKPEPQIMVNVTNDGWFYDSAEPTQHFNNAIFRCIELRRPLIRAANTGVSAFIDDRGSVYDRTSMSPYARILRDEETGSTFIRGSLPGDVLVDLNPPVTFYARYGDVFSITLGLIALFAGAVGAVCSRKREVT